MKLSERLDRHFNDLTEIYQAFGYVEQWRVFPLDDAREMYWLRTPHRVAYQRVPFTPANVESGGALFSNTIYKHRHHSQHVFEADGLVMALLDTQCDGNVFLRIFDASRECKDEEIVNLYRECWG